MGTNASRRFGVVALAVCLAVEIAAQQTFRTTTELVQVDVVVLDADGRPIRGLRAEDFTILDRRKPQHIQTFSEITHTADSELPGPPISVKADVADNSDAQSKRAVIIVVDDMALARSRMGTAADALRQLVSALGPQASTALLFTSGRGSREFTSDRGELVKAIDEMSGRLDRMPPTPDAFYRLHKTMQDAARYLRSDQTRRKALVLVAPGVGDGVNGLFELMRPRPVRDPINDKKGDARQIMIDSTMLAMMDSLRRSNVTLYAVDPRGDMRSQAARFRENPDEDPAPLRMNDPIYQAQEGLRLTAEAAGGFAIIGGAGLNAGIERIVADLDNYYLLGFQPAQNDKDWHDLEVVVNRPGAVVRHRKGYRLGAKPDKPKNKDPMVVISEGVLPRTDLRLRMFAAPVAMSLKTTRVNVVVEMPAASSQRAADRLAVTLLAVDLKKKKVVRRVDRRAEVDALGSAPDSAYQLPFTLELSPGSYQLRASLSSATLEKSGSVYLTLDVPPLPKSGIVIGGITLSKPEGAWLLDRVFPPSSAVRASYSVFSADAGAWTSAAELIDETGKVVSSATPQISGGLATSDLPLTGLVRGSYRLRVTALSATSRAVREVGFAVR